MRVNGIVLIIIIIAIVIGIGSIVFNLFAFSLGLVIRYFPFFLVGGIVYYFVRGKKKGSLDNDNHPFENTPEEHDEPKVRRDPRNPDIIDVNTFTVEEDEES